MTRAGLPSATSGLVKVKVAGTGSPAGKGAGLPSGPTACLVAVIRAATDFGSAASRREAHIHVDDPGPAGREVVPVPA